MSKEYNFSFDVAALTDFVNENLPIVKEMVTMPTTMQSGIEIIPNQKGNFTLNNLSNEVYLTAASCGWNPDPSNATVFGQQEVALEKIQHQDEFCTLDLTTKYTSRMLKPGSNPEEMDAGLESLITDLISDKIGKWLEKMFWQGSKTSGEGNLALVNGVAEFLDGKGSVYVIDASAAMTKDNAIDQVDAMIAAIPEEIFESTDLAIYMNSIDYRTYTSALAATLNAATPEDQNKPYGRSVMAPYTAVEVISTAGVLKGTMYASSKSNFVLGTDLMSDTDNITIKYDEFANIHKVKTAFKMGVGAYWPEFVVHNNPAIG